MEGDDLGAGFDDDVGCGLDLVDEVLGHALFERRAADEHAHLAGVAGEVHGGLAGRVGSADDVDVLVGAGVGLGQGRAVEDAFAAQVFFAGDAEPAVVDAGGDEADAAGDLAAVGHLDDVVAVVGADGGDALGEELGAEALGLDVGALGELVAGEAFRKPR